MSQLPPDKQGEAIKLWHLVQVKRSAAETLLSAGLFNDSLFQAYYSVSILSLYCSSFRIKFLPATKRLLAISTRYLSMEAFFHQELACNLEALFETRQTSDYDYHVHFDRDEALEGILTAIRQYVPNQFRTPLL